LLGGRLTSRLVFARLWAEYLNNLYAFDLINMTWAKVSFGNGSRPSARYWFGFTSDEGKLYVHAGNPVVHGFGERGRSIEGC
jgi:hypothetical protein